MMSESKHIFSVLEVTGFLEKGQRLLSTDLEYVIAKAIGANLYEAPEYESGQGKKITARATIEIISHD